MPVLRLDEEAGPPYFAMTKSRLFLAQSSHSSLERVGGLRRTIGMVCGVAGGRGAARDSDERARQSSRAEGNDSSEEYMVR